MKKITKAFLFYFSLLGFAIFVQSCCNQEFRIIGSGNISANAIIQDQFQQITIVEGEFYLSINYDYEVAFNDYSVGILSTAMATSCIEKVVNPLVESSLKISCDKDFVYDGVAITANSDFSQTPELRNEIYSEYTYANIYFDQPFLDKAVFDNEEYTFKIEINTDDGVELMNEITLTMNL